MNHSINEQQPTRKIRVGLFSYAKRRNTTVETIDESLFENCKWCNGGGKEPDGHYPCPDCQGTGMRGGKYAEDHYHEFLDEQIRKSKQQSQEG